MGSILPDHISKLVKEELRNAIHEYGVEYSHHHPRKRSNVSNVSTISSGRGHSPGGCNGRRDSHNHGVIHKKPFRFVTDAIGHSPFSEIKLNMKALMGEYFSSAINVSQVTPLH